VQRRCENKKNKKMMLTKNTTIRSSILTRLTLVAGIAAALSACGGGATVSESSGTAPQVAPVAIAVESGEPLVRDPVVTAPVADDEAATEDATSTSTSVAEQLVPSAASAEDFLKGVVANDGGFRVMAMGDSITQGVRGASSYRAALKGLMADGGCPVTFVGSQSASSPDVGFYGAHEGYSGHSTTDFLEGRGRNAGAAVNVDYHKPDIVLLHIGSVDIWRDFDVEGTLSRIDQLVALIQSTHPNTFVLLANLIPWVDTSNGADKPVSVAELGDQIEAYVAQSGNPLLQVVDVRSGFAVDMLQKDLIHPNATGDAHIADAYFDHLYSAAYCGG
jgi:lysophospholipase L1-like esterase